ncbi:hypothetical protein [Methylocella silvestris]|uniref:hypothetical protein n=1 Tax=Methylocella silvestris TaxID=199596 RepID=UPI0002FC2416|nr:hypothetical protein [Methylocella silvestris]
MSDKEKVLCEQVYKGSLPPYKYIGIGDGLGVGDRPWTDWGSGMSPDMLPDMLYELNLGDYASADLTTTQWTPYDGNVSDLLIHEMAHVWQYYYGYTVKASSLWASTLGSYDFKPGKAWDDYNAEQQASIVETWHKRGRKKSDELYPYIARIIHGGASPRLTKMTLAELKVDFFYLPDPPPNPTVIAVAPVDALLLPVLAKRYDPSDVAGFGGRVKRLEEIFRSLNELQAEALLARLSSRRSGDQVSITFHDHLSTPTRASLLHILRGISAPIRA